MVPSAQVGAVVVGHDRNFNYYKIQYATLCLRNNPGCKFIATNLDAVTHLTGEPKPYRAVILSDICLTIARQWRLSFRRSGSHDTVIHVIGETSDCRQTLRLLSDCQTAALSVSTRLQLHRC